MQMALLCKYKQVQYIILNIYIYIYNANCKFIVPHDYRVHMISYHYIGRRQIAWFHCDITDLFFNLVGISIPGSRE